MNSSIRRKIRCLFPVLRHSYKQELNTKRTHSNCYIKKDLSKLKPLLKAEVSCNQTRQLYNSNLAKSNDSNTNENGPNDEQNKNVLDDNDFKSILNDFAKDFGVEKESEQILEDIRKTIDDPLNDDSQSSARNEENNSIPANKDSYPASKHKFKEVFDSDAVFIPSYEEDQYSRQEEDYVYHIDQHIESQYMPEQIKRGVFGVYDIEELVEVLRKENLGEITVISVPKELHYTDFLVVATARSQRHAKAVCEHVVKLYKMKKHLKDPFAIVEGDKSSDWKALDMGNIVLHVFLEETRVLYDIESLWLFDAAFDRGGNMKADPLYNAIEEQMAFFNSLNKPATENSTEKET